MKIAISTSSFASADTSALSLLKEKNIEIVNNPYGRKMTENEIITHLNGIDGLLAGLEPLNNNVFHQSPQLKAIARVGIGMDNIDIEAAKAANIKISNTPDGPTNAVAEMTLAALLTIQRSIIAANAALHNKRWKKNISRGLKGSCVLLIGYGRIGGRVAELLKVFTADILVYDPYLADLADPIVRQVDLKEGLEKADVISLHAAGSEAILSSREFSFVKKDVVILNSARGGLIDENALIKALDQEIVAAAWLDVFPEEPYDGPLCDYDQVLLTPHISTYSVQCRRDMEVAAVKNLFVDLGI